MVGKKSRAKKELRQQASLDKPVNKPTQSNSKAGNILQRLFFSYPFIIAIAVIILTLFLGWGLPMILPSTPHNGLVITVIGLILSVPFFFWAFILYKKQQMNQRVFIKKGRGKMIILVSGIVLVVIGFIMVITQLDFKGDSIIPQDIQAKEQSQSVFPTFSVPNQNQTQNIVFSYGNNSFRFTVEELLSGGRKFFTTNGYEPFKAYIVSENSSNNLYVDVNTYGNDRLPPLQIAHNQLKELPQGWDVNYLNGYALEVVNEKQEPILQLIYNNLYHVIINGWITYPNGFAFSNGIITYFDKYPPSNESLKRLFKYPSSLYRGQRVTP